MLHRHLPYLLLIAYAASGCRGGSPAKEAPPDDAGVSAPVPVEVVTIKEGPIEETLQFSTTLAAEIAVQVLARTTGQVERRLFEEGDEVAAGAVLLRLEDREQRSALRRAQSELELADRTLATQQTLHTKGVVSEQSLESAEFDQKRLNIARDDAARALSYTTIRSPIAGTVTQRMVKRGDFVTPNQPLLELTDFDSLVANVFVPEKDIGKVALGSDVRLRAPSTTEPLSNGRVARIAPVVDSRTGTVKVTVEVPTASGLRPGMFVDVELVVDERPRATLLPRRALVYDNDQPYAFKVLASGTVERVAIEPAVSDRLHVEPKSGFAVGDRVVVAGQVGLKDGAKVKVTEAPAAQKAPEPSPKAAPAKPAKPTAKPAKPTAAKPSEAVEPAE